MFFSTSEEEEMKIHMRLLLFALLVFVLSACTPVLVDLVPASENEEVSEDLSNLSATQSPLTSGEIITYTPTLGQNQVNIKIGDILIVKIPTIKEEAFEWIIRDMEKNVLIQEGKAAYVEDPNMDSGGGTFEFIFQTVGVGQTNLTFEYVNEEAKLGKDTFAMTVIVTDGGEKIVLVTPSPRGTSVTLSMGEILLLEIPTIPEEGFHWIVEKLDTSILIQQNESLYIEDKEQDSAGGVYQFRFIPVGRGQTIVNLNYVSKDAMFSKNTFGMSVTVADGVGKTVVVTPSPRGNSATLDVGDMLVLEIPTIPEEGFEWTVADLDNSILVQVGEPEYSADTDPNSAGGVVSFKFTAVGPGETSLSLLYAQITEGEQAFGKDSFGMAVIVK